ncbi:MAG: DUF4136 domain-containing protein [Bacteroidales bacterium]|jgi:hypothetical protein|nr:DUF4136 domain-containing protein [Bacteroidales bacterium]MBO5980224.1 DUF4136 domain-containing protein [Bacteroidales bacterium]
MRKILFISAAVLLMAACQKEPYTSDNDNSYLVYTSPGKDVNFTQYKTFDMTDSLLVIGQGSKPKYVRNDAVKAILLDFRRNMEARGFVYTPDAEAADLGVQLTYVIKTERFVQFYSDPYWWLDYPGYWPSGYWGNWNGYYMPRPVTYTYTTNALLTDIVNLTGEQKEGTPLEILWTSYIGGPAGSTIQGDVTRMTEAIDQAFKQSEYLKNK